MYLYMNTFNRMIGGATVETDVSFDSKISKILELVKAVKDKHAELEKQNNNSSDDTEKEINSLKEKLVIVEADNIKLNETIKELSTNLSEKTDYDNIKSKLEKSKIDITELDKKCSNKDVEIKTLNTVNKELLELVVKIKKEFNQVQTETRDVTELLKKYGKKADPFNEDQQGGDEIDDILNFTETN